MDMFFNGPSFGLGFATGFGTGFFTRELTKGLQVGAKPIAKAVLKTSFQILEKIRETLALAGETFEDLVAEARSELATAEEPGVEEATKRIERAAASGHNTKSRGGAAETRHTDKSEPESTKELKEAGKEFVSDETERSRSKKG